MGSDFTYSDFISKGKGLYGEELMSDGDIDGISFYRIKMYGRTPKEKESFGYAYTINYFGKDDYFLYARDYYESSGDLLKTYRVNKVQKFGEYIFATEVIMTNVQTKHKTIIHTNDISIGDIPERIFSTRNIQK